MKDEFDLHKQLLFVWNKIRSVNTALDGIHVVWHIMMHRTTQILSILTIVSNLELTWRYPLREFCSKQAKPIV